MYKKVALEEYTCQLCLALGDWTLEFYHPDNLSIVLHPFWQLSHVRAHNQIATDLITRLRDLT